MGDCKKDVSGELNYGIMSPVHRRSLYSADRGQDVQKAPADDRRCKAESEQGTAIPCSFCDSNTLHQSVLYIFPELLFF